MLPGEMVYGAARYGGGQILVEEELHVCEKDSLPFLSHNISVCGPIICDSKTPEARPTSSGKWFTAPTVRVLYGLYALILIELADCSRLSNVTHLSFADRKIFTSQSSTE